jgi:hypothetical protein
MTKPGPLRPQRVTGTRRFTGGTGGIIVPDAAGLSSRVPS